MKRYTINGDGTVTDNVTGLMWQQPPAGRRRTWQESMDYANSLELGGHTDWRLPAIYELMGIIDYNRGRPAIDTTAFPSTNAFYYWSSTPYTYDPSYAWAVSFNDGSVLSYFKTSYDYVRCVRTVGEGK